MSRITHVTVGPLATASATNIATYAGSQPVGNLTLNGSLVVGGVATLDQPRRIIVTSGGNDSAITFTAYGTDWSGQPIQSLAVAGANIGAVDLGVSFKTVTRIVLSGASAVAALSVGTNTVADSRPIVLDEFGFPYVALQVSVTGTTNYTVRSSLDNPTRPGASLAPIGMQNCVFLPSSDATVVGAVVSAQSNFAFAPKLVQLTLNSGTGSLYMSLIQHASPTI